MKKITTMKICESAFYGIIDFIGSQKAESGGLLFGYENDYIVRKFIPDIHAETTFNTYSINADYLNPIITKLWNEKNLSVIGAVHSHPNNLPALSEPDNNYFNKLRQNMPRKKFFTPIVFTVPDGGFRLYSYVFLENMKKSVPAKYEIVSDDYSRDCLTENENYNHTIEINHFHYNYYPYRKRMATLHPVYSFLLVALLIIGYTVFFFSVVLFLPFIF